MSVSPQSCRRIPVILILSLVSAKISKLVYLDWGQDTSKFIDRSYEIYTQMRDFHNEVNRINVYVTLCIEVAKATNSTLMSVGNSTTAVNYPTIVPFTLLGGGTKRCVFFYSTTWIAEQNLASFPVEQPLFLQTDIFPLIFAYCDWPRWKRESIWTFSIVTGPLDRKSWLALVSCIGMLTLTIVLHWKLPVIYTVTVVISVLLSPGLSGNFAFVFVLWTLCCGVLSNLYCGYLTSAVIAPPEEHTISNIEELYKHSYKLMFPLKTTLNYIKSFEVEFLQELTENVELIDEINLFKRLALKPKRAIVYPWAVALRALTLANDIANEEDRHCFVGIKLTPVKEIQFVTVLPPDNKEVAKVFGRFIEVGIFDWWLNEFKAWSHSTRVLERVRVVSKIKVIFPTKFYPLKLTGKVQVIFLLWRICCAGSGIVFGLEYMFSKISDKRII